MSPACDHQAYQAGVSAAHRPGTRLGAGRKTAIRITRLIVAIQRDPFAGTGKPEPLKGDLLKGDLSGYWSRRIDDEHRLAYRADDEEVKILKARCHHSD